MENQIEIYQSTNGIELKLLIKDETVWATQRQIAVIFDTTPQNITLHLQRVYNDLEVDLNSTCKEYLQVQKEGTRGNKTKTKGL